MVRVKVTNESTRVHRLIDVTSVAELLNHIRQSSRFGVGTLEDGEVIVSDSYVLTEGVELLWVPANAAPGSHDIEAGASLQRELVVFANINQLPSASDVASNPRTFNEFKTKVSARTGAQLLDHRPHQEHGPPLDILCEQFAQFSQETRTCIPSLEASQLAGALVQLASQVHQDEREDLQAPLYTLFNDFFKTTGLQLTIAGRGMGKADLVGSFDMIDVLLIEIKTDTGGNTAGQLERYAFATFAELFNRGDQWYVGSCAPTLGVEISGAKLRVLGLAIIKTKLLCEPLTTALHLFCSNSQDHMLQLARVLHALHAAVRRLVDLRQAAAVTAAACGPLQQEDSVQWPFQLLRNYPGAKVSQPWGLGRPVYVVETQDQQQLVVKFQQRGWASEEQRRHDQMQQQRGDEGPRCWGIDVQRMWHSVGAAPEVVAVWEAGPLWAACVMRALTLADGWLPLTAWAPARTKDVEQALAATTAHPAPRVLTLEEWGRLSATAQAALQRGHQAHLQAPDSARAEASSAAPLLTVHGDARLSNLMARRDDSSSLGFRVLFVDFGWAGVAERSRYPIMVSPDIHWALGVGPNAIMCQKHDVDLLTQELKCGSGVE